MISSRCYRWLRQTFRSIDGIEMNGLQHLLVQHSSNKYLIINVFDNLSVISWMHILKHLDVVAEAAFNLIAEKTQ